MSELISFLLFLFLSLIINEEFLVSSFLPLSSSSMIHHHLLIFISSSSFLLGQWERTFLPSSSDWEFDKPHDSRGMSELISFLPLPLPHHTLRILGPLLLISPFLPPHPHPHPPPLPLPLPLPHHTLRILGLLLIISPFLLYYPLSSLTFFSL